MLKFTSFANLQNDCTILVLVLCATETKKCRGDDFVTLLTLFDGLTSFEFTLFSKTEVQKLKIGDFVYIKNVKLIEKRVLKAKNVQIFEFDEKIDSITVQKICEDVNKMLKGNKNNEFVHNITYKYVHNSYKEDASNALCIKSEIDTVVKSHMNYLKNAFITNVGNLMQHTKIADMKKGYYTFVGKLKNVKKEMKNLTILYMTDYLNKTDEMLIIKVWDKYTYIAGLLIPNKVYLIKNIKGTLADAYKNMLVVQISESCKAEFKECNINTFTQTKSDYGLKKHSETNSNVDTKNLTDKISTISTKSIDIDYGTLQHCIITKPEIKAFRLIFVHVFNFPAYETNSNKVCDCFFCDSHIIDGTNSKQIICKTEKKIPYKKNKFSVILALVIDHNKNTNYVYIKSTVFDKFDFKKAIKNETVVICDVLCDSIDSKNIFTIIDIV